MRTAILHLVFTGKQFRITTPTMALDETGVQRNSITLPAGAIVDVIDGPKPDHPLVRVVWGRHWLLMYEQDLCERAEEVTS